MRGLFQAATLVKKKTFAESTRCGQCGLHKACKRPKLAPQGSGASRILIVLPETTAESDQTGEFANGHVYKLLRQIFQKQGKSVLKECWLTAATICHSKQEPTGEQIDACSFKLRTLIDELQPTLVIAIDAPAIRNAIQFTWNRAAGLTTRFEGYIIPSRRHNLWLACVMLPTGAVKDCSDLLFTQQVTRALRFAGEAPFDSIPDPPEFLLLDDVDGTRFLQRILKKKGTAAWDYETNSLKPEHRRSRILTASFCWKGGVTAAFPYAGNVPGCIAAFCRDSEILKIASNLQFEHRWTLHHLGVKTKGWLWDTMQAAHALDNRKQASSIKFQSFALLGYQSYDDHIHEFLIGDDTKGEGDSHAVNRAIEEIPLKDLLTYNAMDSFLEYEVAKVQARIMKHPAYRSM
jgi:hypothetical protein